MYHKIGSAILFGMLGLLFLGFIGFWGLVFIQMMSKHPVFYTCIWISALVLLELAIIVSVFENITSRSWFKRGLLGGLGICLLLSLGYKTYTYYDDSLIAVNVQDVDLTAYQPFSDNNKLVQLQEPASYQLQLDDKLPTLNGATALYPVYAAFAQAVYPKQEYYLYDSPVQASGTGSAYEALIMGEVNMIFAAAPSDGQQRLADRNHARLYLTPIGNEAFVFFVNKDNPVSNLTSEQVKKIYAGEITNWNQVGGSNKPIRAFQRPEDSGSQAMLRRWMGDTPVMEPMTETLASGMGGIMEEVTAYHNYSSAIGFSFHYFATQMNPEEDIKLLSIDGVYPDDEHIRSGEYKLTAPFYAITAGKKYTGATIGTTAEDPSAAIQLPPKGAGLSSNPSLRPLLEWILSPQGQSIIEQTGYFPIHSPRQ